MEAKHTATPWRMEQVGEHDFDIDADDSDFGTVTIATVGKSNAAFIVRACNAHDELVAALVLAQGQIAVLGGTPDPEDRFANQIQIAVQKQLREALTKAGCK